MIKELNSELMNESQKGHMKVHSKILKDLSSGIYSNPANAIKELIINSYDADASKVTIRAKPDLDSFTIIDDGNGMNCDDFESKFAWISHSEKRKETDFTEKYRRPFVGRFGIGFISTSQLCDKMTVISSKAGETKKFRADIDFSQYKEHTPYGEPKDVYEVSEFDFINLEEEAEEHYTIIVLLRLDKDFIKLLTDKSILEKLEEMEETERKKYERINIEDISFDEIIDVISQKKIKEIEKKIGTYWQFIFDIANTVPVPYLPNGPLDISEKNTILKGIIEDVKKYNFSVEIDGIELKKPIILPNSKDINKIDEDFNVYFFNEEITIDNNNLKFRGYFYNQKNSISPYDFQGILIRIRNVSVGKTDKNFINYPWSERMWMPWTFCEIYVDEGLEDALNINRNSFIITHPHYMYIQKFIHDYLHEIIFRRARKRYDERKKKKKKQQEKVRTKIITNTLQQTVKKKEIAKTHEISNKKIPEELEISIKKDTPEIDRETTEATDVKIFHLSQKSKEKELSEYLKLHDLNKSEPVIIDNEKRIIILNDRHIVFSKLNKKDKELLEEILIFFELALKSSKGDVEKLKHFFFKNIAGWRR